MDDTDNPHGLPWRVEPVGVLLAKIVNCDGNEIASDMLPDTARFIVTAANAIHSRDALLCELGNLIEIAETGLVPTEEDLARARAAIELGKA